MAWRGRDEALECKSIDEFKSYLQGLAFSWRPSGMVVHNTASPTLEQWWNSVPPEQRMENLINYYRDELGWSAGPHAFVDGVSIWVLTDFNVQGVHSPSWNGTRLGIEMVGDYDTESDESGMGLKVMEMSVALFGECHSFFGWEPDNNSIKLHKEDPNTTHDCPGRNVIKSEFVEDVTEYMGEGGDHGDGISTSVSRGVVYDVPAGDTLTIRARASSSSEAIGTLQNGDNVLISGEAYNRSTKWLQLRIGLQVKVAGWVSAAYVEVRETVPEPGAEPLFYAKGRMSTFGGPDDTGVAADEGLAFWSSAEEMEAHDAGDYIMSEAQAGAPGLARRLVPEKNYVACRWDYDVTSKAFLRDATATVSAHGRTIRGVRPMDWGPHEDTGRVADLSPGLAEALRLSTDDTCEVTVYS